MRITKIKYRRPEHSIGSALILAVVLSSLLAIVGVLFVMVARIERISSTAVSENAELNFAVDTVIAGISRQLAQDVPGIVDQAQEYYDYPDANNPWLASLEPYKSENDYYWSQISDITEDPNNSTRDIQADIVHEYDTITEPNSSIATADADGDGIGDSKWFEIDGITSTKGNPIYAAVRIIDNASMLNVNTAFKFDPGDPNALIVNVDGSHQLQVNLMALTTEPNQSPTLAKQIELLNERANYGGNVDPFDMDAYLANVVWDYDDPNGYYTPFDLSDELELRYRYILNQTDIDTRLEEWCEGLRSNTLSTPVTSGGADFDAWFLKAAGSGTFNPNYALRHIATIYNIDRIINPDGTGFNNGKMLNVNTVADPNLLYDAIRAGMRDFADPNSTMLADEIAANLAVNIIDLRDEDMDITEFTPANKTYYGLEAQPFINEIGFRIASNNAEISSENNFAVELYNPFEVDIPLSDFRLQLRDANDSVVQTLRLTGYVIGAESRFVITNNSTSTSRFGIDNIISTGRGKEDPNLVLATYSLVGTDPPTYELDQRYNISLARVVTDGQLYLDRQTTENDWFDWDEIKDIQQFYCRNDNNGNMVYQTLAKSDNTLGRTNQTSGLLINYNLTDSTRFFHGVGDIARALIITASADPNETLGARLASQPPEADIRMDLQNPAFSNIFQYLTVIDPTEFGHSAEETRVKGRININTAPWYVLSQLPWMQPAIAQNVVTYRQTNGPFKTIGELTHVPLMDFYANDSVDLDIWPDLTPGDGAINDFEERDVIFSRISNLTTVRSDVFTAYITVRLETDGPQRKVIAIFDRSLVTSAGDKVEVLAVHPVPDPR
ncbi:ComEA family DNA-binding protein [Planctomycetota bacterium]